MGGLGGLEYLREFGELMLTRHLVTQDKKTSPLIAQAQDVMAVPQTFTESQSHVPSCWAPGDTGMKRRG